MVKNWCNVLSMEGVTVCGHHPECRVTFGRGVSQLKTMFICRHWYLPGLVYYAGLKSVQLELLTSIYGVSILIRSLYLHR